MKTLWSPYRPVGQARAAALHAVGQRRRVERLPDARGPAGRDLDLRRLLGLPSRPIQSRRTASRSSFASSRRAPASAGHQAVGGLLEVGRRAAVAQLAVEQRRLDGLDVELPRLALEADQLPGQGVDGVVQLGDLGGRQVELPLEQHGLEDRVGRHRLERRPRSRPAGPARRRADTSSAARPRWSSASARRRPGPRAPAAGPRRSGRSWARPSGSCRAGWPPARRTPARRACDPPRSASAAPDHRCASSGSRSFRTFEPSSPFSPAASSRTRTRAPIFISTGSCIEDFRRTGPPPSVWARTR